MNPHILPIWKAYCDLSHIKTEIHSGRCQESFLIGNRGIASGLVVVPNSPNYIKRFFKRTSIIQDADPSNLVFSLNFY